jgi:flavin reductase (DIM6/NTAB) family NADH-FMN oxidoreductase RutF
VFDAFNQHVCCLQCETSLYEISWKFIHNHPMRSPRPAPPSADVRASNPDFEPPHFRQALSRFATGVTVVTTRALGAGADSTASADFIGLTASSFNSVSLSPPLVLWSLALKSGKLPAFHAQTHYVINVLAADQLALCERFAYGQGNRFEGVDYQLSRNGLPILQGALAWFECHNRSRYEEGDHVIFVGEVERCGFAQGQPLVYQASQFGTLAALG